jgi:flagellar basal body rod protein FlgF
MTTEPLPTGWLSVEEAARATNSSEAEIRLAARRIKPAGFYTIYGRPVGWEGAPSDLPAMPGHQLKRLHRGRIILNRAMVMAWKQAIDRIRDGLAAGDLISEREIAAKHGVTIAEVRRANKRVEEREKRAQQLQGVNRP